jgi:hypothetical protein
MSAAIKCPTRGVFTADGSAQIETAVMHEVSLETADQTFTVANAAPFGHFSISQNGENSTPGVLDFVVSVNASSLADSLAGWLNGGALVNGVNVHDYMLEYVRSEINDRVASTGLGQALEATVVKDLAFASWAVDASAGALDLATRLAANQADLDSIGLQFPEGRYPTQFASTLPSQSGDSLTFQFTISSTISVSAAAKDTIVNANGSAGITNANPAVNTYSALRSRIVHITASQ